MVINYFKQLIKKYISKTLFCFILFLISMSSFIWLAPSPGSKPLIPVVTHHGVLKDKYYHNDDYIFVFSKDDMTSVSKNVYDYWNIGESLQITERVENYEGKRWLYYLTAWASVISFMAFLFFSLDTIVDKSR